MKRMMLTCFEIVSSVLNSSSKPRFLICSSSAVAICTWVSSVAFLAVNSGSCVIAVLRWVALAERSLKETLLVKSGCMDAFAPTVLRYRLHR